MPNYAINDLANVRQRLTQDGYLLLRGFLPRQQVLEAREAILKDLMNNGFVVPAKPKEASELNYLTRTEGNPTELDRDLTEEARAPAKDASVSPGLLARQDLTGHPAVKKVLEHEKTSEFFAWLFGQPPVVIGYKWLRAVAKDLFTGVHVDRVYVGGGSERLHTAWIPLGDVPVTMGSLVVATGSHASEQFRQVREIYNNSKVGKDGVESGWLTDDASAVKVRTLFFDNSLCLW